MDILFPIASRIDNLLKEEFSTKILPSLTNLNDRLICRISSPGGESNIASYFVTAITRLPMKTIIFAGPFVYSAGAIIFSSFDERFAFVDSKFLIHKCIPPKGMLRTEIFDQFDHEIWDFMSKRMKISFEDLRIIAKKAIE